VPRGRGETKLGLGVGLSAVVHLSAAAALILFARDTPPRTSQAPTYRVNIVAAPPGPRQSSAKKSPSCAIRTSPKRKIRSVLVSLKSVTVTRWNWAS